MMKIRFGVYEHRITYGDGEILTRSIIVLKDADDDIVGWIDFHRYAKSRKNSLSKSIHSDPNKSCKNIVMFLNYSFFDKYNVKKLNDITNDMVRDFLTDYGLCRLPYDENTHRGKETVDCCIKNIINFVSSLKKNNPDAKVNPSDLFTTEQVFSKRKKRYFSVEIPTFEVNYNPSSNKIFRDITEGAFQIIMDEILINHTNILMLAALGAFAGLRPSEACNVRRADSVLGAGIIFKTVDGEVTDIIIDLKKERILNLFKDLDYYRIKEINDKKYIIVHAGYITNKGYSRFCMKGLSPSYLRWGIEYFYMWAKKDSMYLRYI